MVQKWPYKSRGCPQESPKFPYKKKKRPKPNALTEYRVIALKRVKCTENYKKMDNDS